MEIDNQLETITAENSDTISFGNNGSVLLPSGTSAQRPAVPQEGMTRMNNELGLMEVYQQGSWRLQVTLPETSIDILNSLGSISSAALCLCVDKDISDVNINTVGPNNIFTYTITGGSIATNGILRLRMGGLFDKTTSSKRYATFSLILGGTVVYSDTTNSMSSTGKRGWFLEWDIIANNSQTSQKHMGVFYRSDKNLPNIGQSGAIDEDFKSSSVIVGDNSSIDLSVNQPMNVSITFSGSGISLTKLYHTLEVL